MFEEYGDIDDAVDTVEENEEEEYYTEHADQHNLKQDMKYASNMLLHCVGKQQK